MRTRNRKHMNVISKDIKVIPGLLHNMLQLNVWDANILGKTREQRDGLWNCVKDKWQYHLKKYL